MKQGGKDRRLPDQQEGLPRPEPLNLDPPPGQRAALKIRPSRMTSHQPRVIHEDGSHARIVAA
jgi:hypothetical protein